MRSGATRNGEKREGLPIESREVLQLDEIDAALARFDFRDEGLRTGQSTGDFYLCQPSILACFPQ
jgi:hypothetical protein